MLLRLGALTLLVALLNGCVIAVNTDDWEDDAWVSRQNKNAELIDTLVLGTSQTEVEAQFGEPDFTEAFIRNKNEYSILYYRTRHNDHDGKTTIDETTPLVFTNNELVGWGESAIEFATAD